MIRFTVCFLLFLSAAARLAIAEDAVLRSADHNGFTRVAIDLKNPKAVKVDLVENRLLVSLPQTVDEIIADRFFDRITRERITKLDASSDNKSLTFLLACRCGFKTFVAGKNTLVIDISNVESVSKDSAESSEKPAWPELNRANRRKLSFSLKATEIAEPNHAAKVAEAPLQKPFRITFPREKVVHNQVTERLHSAMESAFAKSVESNKDAARVANVEIGNDQISFRSHAVKQQDGIERLEQVAKEELGNCDRAKGLDPSQWQKYESARQQLIETRQNVAFGFEDFDKTVSRTLAKTYLGLAMGAEALAILSAFEEPSHLDKSLQHLARFTDGEIRELGEAWFAGMTGCPELLIWRILDRANETSKDARSARLSENELLTARAQFQQWPSALQGVFGPRLAKAFSELDAVDTAKFTLRKSDAQPSLNSGERELVSATVNAATLGPAELKNALRPVALADNDVSPAAVISLATLAAEQGEDLGSQETDALISYQDELKGTELEPELLRARIVTAIQSQNFVVATELIGEYATLVRASKTNIVLDDLGAAIYGIDADAMFLREAVSLPASYFSKIAEETQEQIKDRIATLGFAELAQQLGRAQRGNASRNDRTAGARATATTSDAEATKAPLTGDARRDTGRSNATGPAAVSEGAIRGTEPDRTAALVASETPLASAIQESQTVLDSLDNLKAELENLGL